MSRTLFYYFVIVS